MWPAGWEAWVKPWPEQDWWQRRGPIWKTATGADGGYWWAEIGPEPVSCMGSGVVYWTARICQAGAVLATGSTRLSVNGLRSREAAERVLFTFAQELAAEQNA